MGNPAAGVLVLLAALYLLLAFFSGRLEWLFAAVANPAEAVSGDVTGYPNPGLLPTRPRPSTVAAPRAPRAA
jgi:hypothetical protein